MAVFIAGSMPYLARDPMLVMGSLFGYNPGTGLWGLPLLALLVSEEALTRYLLIGKYVAIGATLLASVWVYLRAPGCSLFRRCGMIAFLFLFLAPGFGMQYLAWLVPWSAGVSWRGVRWYYALVSFDVVFFYGAFSRWQWRIVNVFDYTPPYVALVGIFQIACWISVGAVAVVYGKSIFDAPANTPLRTKWMSEPNANKPRVSPSPTR